MPCSNKALSTEITTLLMDDSLYELATQSNAIAFAAPRKGLHDLPGGKLHD
jgi:hypothetical protein